MTSEYKKLTLALLCLTAAGAVLAAQPGAKLPVTTTPMAGTIGAVQMSPAGVLDGVNPIDSSNENAVIWAGKEMLFAFLGAGFCNVELNPGDGGPALKFDGKLPFKIKYTYSEGSMLQSPVFKSFPLTITTLGKCTNKVGPRSALVYKPQPPHVISIHLASGVVAGAATLLGVTGIGKCKYHVSYVNLDAQGNRIAKPYPVIPMNAADIGPFSTTWKVLDATPAGTYKWTAVGVEGCTGNLNTTFTVQ